MHIDRERARFEDGALFSEVSSAPRGINSTDEVIWIKSNNVYGGYVDLSYASITVMPDGIHVVGPVVVVPYLVGGRFEGNTAFIIPYGSTNYQTVLAQLRTLETIPGMNTSMAV